MPPLPGLGDKVIGLNPRIDIRGWDCVAASAAEDLVVDSLD